MGTHVQAAVPSVIPPEVARENLRLRKPRLQGARAQNRRVPAVHNARRVRQVIARPQRPSLPKSTHPSCHITCVKSRKNLARILGLSSRVQHRPGRRPPVTPYMGVPQGNPISPTPSGLFSDALPRYLKHQCPVCDRSRRSMCPSVGYADDFRLVATSRRLTASHRRHTRRV